MNGSVLWIGLLGCLLSCSLLVVAKLPQYRGKEIFEKSFQACHTLEADKALMRSFEMPMGRGQAGCITNYFWKHFQLVQSDKTTDVEKVKQQFVDFGMSVPEDTETLRNINVDTEQDKLGENTFKWLKNNRDAIRTVYFGNPKETFE